MLDTGRPPRKAPRLLQSSRRLADGRWTGVMGNSQVWLNVIEEGQLTHGMARTSYVRVIGGEIYETQEARVRLADLEPVSVDIRFHQGGHYFVIDGDFEPGRVTGRTRVVRPGQEAVNHAIDTPLPDGAILRASFFILAAALPMEIGDEVSFRWYAPLGNSTADVTLSAVEAVQVETPAGRFATYRIEQRGGTPANDIFIDRETGRIVRIDIGGQPMRFVAPVLVGAASGAGPNN